MLAKDLYLDLVAKLPKNYQLYMFSHFKISQLGKKLKKAVTEEEKKHFQNLFDLKKQFDTYKKWDSKHKKAMFVDRRKYKKMYAQKKEELGDDHPETLEAKIGYIYTIQFPKDRKYMLLSQVIELEAAKMEIYAEVRDRVTSGELDMQPIKRELNIPGKQPTFCSDKTPEQKAKTKAEKVKRRDERKLKKEQALHNKQRGNTRTMLTTK